jgi:hypothetical protein
MADASPPKWHLGHTTWFFEQFLLRPQQEQGLDLAYEPAPATWSFLFNSYYDAVGDRHPRPQRGLLSRPSLGEVLAWRERLDGAVQALLEQLEPGDPQLELVELGLQHEQQHQELLLMDLLDGFSRNPLEPVYGPEPEATYRKGAGQGQGGSGEAWLDHEGGLVATRGAPSISTTRLPVTANGWTPSRSAPSW